MISNIGGNSESSIGEREYENLLREGVTAVKEGRMTYANRLLQRATMIKPLDSRPWLWLSATTEEPNEQRRYLEKAVAADPGNAAARRGLLILQKNSKEPDPQPVPALEAEESSAPAPQEIEPARSESFICPECGGRIQFDAQQESLVCESCGYTQETREPLAPDTSEQPIDPVLLTRQAHEWAATQKQLTCDRCGAVSLLPPDQTTNRCPYCGSNQIVQAESLAELIEPQVIGLMKIDGKDARARARTWLEKGALSPRNLAKKARQLRLRPAYYPFWTFDGTVEIPWTCLVREGYGENAPWVTRTGSETRFFNDILIPGFKGMRSREVRRIEPFNLKDLVEFTPEHLAGWPALTYTVAMADASLSAREKVIKKFKRLTIQNIAPVQDKKDVRLGAGKWSGMTFKQVLLPVWAGSYHYQGKVYRFLINGQTGKVGGEKPKDAFKLASVWIAIAIIALILILVLGWVFVTYGNTLFAQLFQTLSEQVSP